MCTYERSDAHTHTYVHTRVRSALDQLYFMRSDFVASLENRSAVLHLSRRTMLTRLTHLAHRAPGVYALIREHRRNIAQSSQSFFSRSWTESSRAKFYRGVCIVAQRHRHARDYVNGLQKFSRPGHASGTRSTELFSSIRDRFQAINLRYVPLSTGHLFLIIGNSLS